MQLSLIAVALSAFAVSVSAQNSTAGYVMPTVSPAKPLTPAASGTVKPSGTGSPIAFSGASSERFSGSALALVVAGGVAFML